MWVTMLDGSVSPARCRPPGARDVESEGDGNRTLSSQALISVPRRMAPAMTRYTRSRSGGPLALEGLPDSRQDTEVAQCLLRG